MIYLVTNQKSFFEEKLFDFIDIDKAIEYLQQLDEIGIDSETAGLDCFTKRLLLLQLGNEEFQILFDIDSFGGIIPQKLKDFLNSSKAVFVFQNAK